MNDEFRVTARTATSFQFPAPNGVTTVSGTISARVSPLGFEAAFTGTNKRAYRSKNPQSTGNMLLVNDGLKTPDYDTNWAKWGNVGIVSAMSDIDTITGIQAPFDPAAPTQNWEQVSGGQWGWHKWYFARQYGYENYGDGGSFARNWVIVGDDRLFYLFIQYGWGGTGRAQYCFGDINSYRPGDQTHTILCADDNYAGNSNYMPQPGGFNEYGFARHASYQGKVLLRSHTQVGNHIRWSTVGTLSSVSGSSEPGVIPFPNGPDYSLILIPTMCRQEDYNIRGDMPGMYWVPHFRPYPDLTVVGNIATLPNRNVALIYSHYNSDSAGCTTAFDITGPWR
jgi:hypothetical protein